MQMRRANAWFEFWGPLKTLFYVVVLERNLEILKFFYEPNFFFASDIKKEKSCKKCIFNTSLPLSYLNNIP